MAVHLCTVWAPLDFLMAPFIGGSDLWGNPSIPESVFTFLLRVVTTQILLRVFSQVPRGEDSHRCSVPPPLLGVGPMAVRLGTPVAQTLLETSSRLRRLSDGIPLMAGAYPVATNGGNPIVAFGCGSFETTPDV